MNHLLIIYELSIKNNVVFFVIKFIFVIWFYYCIWKHCIKNLDVPWYFLSSDDKNYIV